MGRLLETRFNAGKRQSMRVVGGEGVRFELDDGRRVIDGSNTGGPLGNRHPDLVAAVRRAADSPVVNDGWLWAEREEAARDLIDIAFKGEESWIGAVRFFLSGSEAKRHAAAIRAAPSSVGRIARSNAEPGAAGAMAATRRLRVSRTNGPAATRSRLARNASIGASSVVSIQRSTSSCGARSTRASRGTPPTACAAVRRMFA